MEILLETSATFGTAASHLHHSLMGDTMNCIVLQTSVFSPRGIHFVAKLLIQLLRRQKLFTFGSKNTLAVAQKNILKTCLFFI